MSSQRQLAQNLIISLETPIIEDKEPEVTTDMMTLLMIGCGLGIIVLIALIIGLIFIAQSGERDTVSTAREGWIQRRSDKDNDAQ